MAGCASSTAYRKPDIGINVPRVSISGMKYVRAKELAAGYSADWQWDSTSRILTLSKSQSQLKVMNGSSLVCVNGNILSLSSEVKIKDGESGERLLRRFGTHIKSRRLLQKFRQLRYFMQKPCKRITRRSAVMREKHRAEAKRKQFLG